MTRFLFLGLTFLVATGCAMTPMRPTVSHGPGAVFESVEDAAVDALSYAFLEARAANESERSLAGTIFPVEGGFSYGALEQASRFMPNRVFYSLRPHDVAHFHTYPTHWDRRVNSQNETHSLADRRVVDTLDPLHRPSFILTPTGYVRVYRGSETEVEPIAKVHGADATTRLFAAIRRP